MPLVLSFVSIGYFVRTAQNLFTYLEARSYPGQSSGDGGWCRQTR
jgi:uncharacterized membrane protein YoaT (DUF817 family)